MASTKQASLETLALDEWQTHIRWTGREASVTKKSRLLLLLTTNPFKDLKVCVLDNSGVQDDYSNQKLPNWILYLPPPYTNGKENNEGEGGGEGGRRWGRRELFSLSYVVTPALLTTSSLHNQSSLHFFFCNKTSQTLTDLATSFSRFSCLYLPLPNEDTWLLGI